MRRLKALMVRLTDEELLSLKATADKAKLSVSDHVRRLLGFGLRHRTDRAASPSGAGPTRQGLP